MNDTDTHFIHELEKLSHYLHGANNTCENENASAAFYQAKHYLDEIIQNIKIQHSKQVAFMATHNP